MSLHWRIMGATVLVVLLTVLASVAVGYYATQARLGVFVDRIGTEEAAQLARDISREYTAAGGWATVDRALSEAGYIYDSPREGENHREGEEGSSELFHQDQVRVVITGLDGRVVMDNLSVLSPEDITSELEGRQETVFDLANDQPVGYVYVDVNQEYLSTETHGFLNTLLYITAIGGALTIGIAILVAFWLSRRITAPVKALTEATQSIAQGDATRLPVTSSDELGRMSEAFNRMTSALETQRELRRRLINDVSHELNTPLSVIKLEAKGLRDGLQSPESASDHIIQEVDRLGGIVTDLDWLAETDHGELRLAREATSVYELFTAEVNRWQPQCEAGQVALSLDLSPDLPSMDVDRMRMSQALGNIINNAIHCTEAGGSIQLKVRQEGDEALVVSITDDGIGIDAADIPHVFDRFYRTDQSRNRGVGGTGLGLAITRAIIEAHGGTVDVASDGPGQGVTVTIRLPVSE
ncbi:MAG: ATP-binding protein [Chloroflexi bacterium]|nr:ATP-binding protein [Chloroflexota bacterium]